MVMELKRASETFDGKARNEAIKTSSTADAEFYFGWTYGALVRKQLMRLGIRVYFKAQIK